MSKLQITIKFKLWVKFYLGIGLVVKEVEARVSGLKDTLLEELLVKLQSQMSLLFEQNLESFVKPTESPKVRVGDVRKSHIKESIFPDINDYSDFEETPTKHEPNRSTALVPRVVTSPTKSMSLMTKDLSKPLKSHLSSFKSASKYSPL